MEVGREVRGEEEMWGIWRVGLGGEGVPPVDSPTKGLPLVGAPSHRLVAADPPSRPPPNAPGKGWASWHA